MQFDENSIYIISAYFFAFFILGLLFISTYISYKKSKSYKKNEAKA
ncbi:MAG: hypothetical protein SFT90_04960 [Rickettsiales bacterium]|nr:hypothetical protein [Rickettsiales bacterium]